MSQPLQSPLPMFRRTIGISVAQLAKMTRISGARIARFERCECGPRLDEIPLLAAALNVTPREIIGTRNLPPQPPALSYRVQEAQVLAASSEPMDALRLALHQAQDGLIIAENADAFTTESNREISYWRDQLRRCEDRLYAAHQALKAGSKQVAAQAQPSEVA